MENKFAIERLEGRGITTVVNDGGKSYITYVDFANAAGYPEAVTKDFHKQKREQAYALVGETVRVLAKGKHERSPQKIYVVVSESGEKFLFGGDGLDFIPCPPRYDTAAEKARDAVEELRLAAYEQGYADAKRDLTQVAPIDMALTRDEIIEKAKRDVEDLKVTHHPTLQQYYCVGPMGMIECDAEFIGNKTKRTVVCLLRKRNYGKGIIVVKGIAKADPSDCFNVHIGKAIALRRALGLEVPAEYYNAPQPTEVRVGDVVTYEGYMVTVMPEHGGLYDYSEGTCGIGSFVANEGKVIDDSREELAGHGFSN